MKSRTMFNCAFFVALLLATTFVPSSFGQSADRQQPAAQKKLDPHQISRLAVSAKTPEDHAKVAEYYQEQAAYFESQSRAAAVKLAAYKRSPYLDPCLMCVNSSDSLEAAVRALQIGKQSAEEQAEEMSKLALIQRQMSHVSFQ